MAREIKLAGLVFRLLDEHEIAALVSDCQHIWAPLDKEVIINPAREFVEGCGSNFVAVKISSGKICQRCGLFEPCNEGKNPRVSTAHFERILKQRPRKNRTICQLLRELRETVEDTEKIDACLLIAKKMNDKLVSYAGRQYTRDWYDDEGDFRDEAN